MPDRFIPLTEIDPSPFADCDDHLYIVRDLRTDCLKVGRSTDPESRIRQLQTGCPGTLRTELVVEDGGWLEPVILQVFSGFTIRGEWFERESPVDSIVRLPGVTPRLTIGVPEALMRIGREIFFLGNGTMPANESNAVSLIDTPLELRAMFRRIRRFARMDLRMAQPGPEPESAENLH